MVSEVSLRAVRRDCGLQRPVVVALLSVTPFLTCAIIVVLATWNFGCWFGELERRPVKDCHEQQSLEETGADGEVVVDGG